ncbi:substrate-binding domain-containing protein [Nocardioides mangrovi]|uniref:Substrate-binding domain-containing protein n=1 Tax=Nocardioides mangrovi TaxID=2874580 RepID=A0ABS7UGH7_9ACTN|nr:substrate-binding domain-containing protein [Nocardioides mangrovi]MBZ5740141.1 substrate-binding domain-containing protein [Nocardioides mangrovi]
MLPTRRCAALVAGVLAVALLAGCSGQPGSAPAPTPSAPPASTAPAPSGPTGSVVVLQRDGDVDRERGFDKETFDAELAQDCPGCTVTHQDAKGQYQTQTGQLSTLVGTDVDVVVLDPVNPLTVVTFVDQLRDYGTKVIVIGASVEGADVRVAFDDEAVGTDQARALLRAADTRTPQLLVVNGSPADPTAVTVKAAAHAVLDDSRAGIVGEYDDLGTRPRLLQTWLATLLTYYPPDVLGGVYAADDRIAGEVIDALGAAGATPATMPPVTGADAELDAVRRVVAGTQLMTVYRPLGPGSRRTAQLTAALLAGTDLGSTTEVAGTPTVLLDPVPVAAEDVADTVVADGYWTADQICTKALARACRKAGVRQGE